MSRPEADKMDLTKYASREPSELHQAFAAWVTENTGYDPTGAKTKKDAFLVGIMLDKYLGGVYQASPENHARMEAARAAKAASLPLKKAAAEVVDKPAPVKRAKSTKAVKAAPAKVETVVEDAPVKPARRPRATKAGAAVVEPVEAPAKPARRPARRPVKATAETVAAPF